MDKLNLDWRIRLGIGILLLAGTIGFFLFGMGLRQSGEPYNHIWIMALFMAWVGSDSILKSLRLRTKGEKDPPENSQVHQDQERS